ncbi:hypothetical protein BOSE127_230013 [Bosea sp. 127]|nr:hypothetical protein BOSE127_230013 [Bosea sp. 127]
MPGTWSNHIRRPCLSFVRLEGRAARGQHKFPAPTGKSGSENLFL